MTIENLDEGESPDEILTEIMARCHSDNPNDDSCCWIWDSAVCYGAVRTNRYPAYYPGPQKNSRKIDVRRFLFEYLERPLAPREVVKTACGNTLCVSPFHIVTGFNRKVRGEDLPMRTGVLENRLIRRPSAQPKTKGLIRSRMNAKAAATRTLAAACPNGHPYVPGSYTVTGQGYRSCRTCRHFHNQKSKAKRRNAPKTTNLRERAEAYLKSV